MTAVTSPETWPTPAHDVLSLGCGRVRHAGAVNVDCSSAVGADVVHDLNRRPWPFPDDSFRAVHARDVLEHLDDTIGTMAEIHRVCRRGAVLHLTVPHYSSVGAYADPTHRRFFAAATFDYFTDGHPLQYYGGGRFRIRRLQLVFEPTLANKVVWRLANRFRGLYERRWAGLFPASFIYAELEVVKES